jgi:hypothetical protein
MSYPLPQPRRRPGIEPCQQPGLLHLPLARRNLCWDKKTVFIEGTSTTSRTITHLEEVHSINENGPIPEAANTPPTAAKLQAYGARQAATSRVCAEMVESWAIAHASGRR